MHTHKQHIVIFASQLLVDHTACLSLHGVNPIFVTTENMNTLARVLPLADVRVGSALLCMIDCF